MGWAKAHIEKLRRGEVVSFRPRGNSMSGRIESGDLVTVEPLRDGELSIGDIVLCRARGAEYLHFVKGVQGKRVLIGNNRGRVNGWTTRSSIFGKLVRVEK
jgi:SOS-response transcriptional repressor LexA